MGEAIKLFKQAIFNEVRAGAFYSYAAEVTSHDESRMLFLELSDMEDDHAKKLVKQIGKESFAKDFDAKDYLKELEKETNDTLELSERKVISSGDMTAVLKMAIALEEAARKTYSKLGKKAKNKDAEKLCKALEKEEEEHRDSLTRTLNNLNMDADERPGL